MNIFQNPFPNSAGLSTIILFLIGIGCPGLAQISLTNGEHSLELSGSITNFYNHRFYYPQNPDNRINNDPNQPFDKGKNRFALRDMQIQLEGRVGHDVEYEFQVDFADLVNPSDAGENPGIMDANFTWKGWKPFNLILGYQKIPFSRNSLVPFTFSPYWQRAELTRGEVFSRRDVGLTLTKSLVNQRLNLFAGLYSGQGEQILSSNGGDNDPSGNLEYVARVDFAFPSRFRYRDFDVHQSPLPMVQVGVAARTVKRKYSSFLPGDDYYLRVISGRKECFTTDVSFMWKGISLQCEWHLINIHPTNDIDPSGNRYRETRGTFASKIGDKPTKFFRAGGLLATLSYSSKPLRSIFSVRYDQLNPNDLVLKNNEECLTFAYAYQVKGFNSMIKAQYNYRLVDRKNTLIQRFDDQLRIGWQFLLK